jgi:hypothetical protein
MLGLTQLKRPRTWLIVSTVGLLGTGAHWCRELVRIDSCLDAGHVYNYVEEVCDHDAVTLPVIPYEVRHPWVIWTGIGVAVAGVAVAMILAGVERPPGARQA